MTDFEPPKAPVVAKNNHGVELLAKGKVDEAVHELEAATALDATFTLARYNLACARARANDFDGAYADLEAVFEVDFVGMRAHAAEDGDLAEFWKSPQGVKLARRIPSYEARYRAVIDRGVRAILWHSTTSTNIYTHRGNFRPNYVRVGVYDPDTHRFVAVAPPMPSAFFGFSSSLVPFAVVATGTVREELGGDMDAGMNVDTIRVFPISTAGVPVATLPVHGETESSFLSLGAAGAHYVAHNATMPFDGNNMSDKYGLTVDVTFGQPVVRKLHGNGNPTPLVSVLTRDHPVLLELGYSHWGYVVDESDGAYGYKPFELVLPPGAKALKVAIPRANAFHRASARVMASPTGDRVVLEWHATVLECHPTADIPGRFKLALVTVATGAVTSLGEGDGAGHAAFRANGELFVQRGKRVYAIAAAGTETTLPEGVLLVPPLAHDDACGF